MKPLRNNGVKVAHPETFFALKRPLNVLLIKLDHRGDLILSIPAIRRLSLLLPDAFTDIVVGSWNVELCREIHPFREVFAFDFFKPKSEELPFAQEAEVERFAKTLGHYDIAIDLRRSPDTRFLLGKVQAPLKIGYATGTALDNDIDICLPQENDNYEIGVAKAKNKVSSARQIVSLIDAIPVKSFEWNPRRRDTNQKCVVSLFPGAGQAIKQWPIPHFVALTQQLLACNHIDRVDVFLAKGEDEGAFLQVSDAGGKLSVHAGLQMAEVLKKIGESKLVVGNNSFGAHVGSIYGIPAVGIYGGHECWEEWEPILSEARVVYSDVSCRPCHLDRIERCPHDHVCLRQISSDSVFQVVLEMLGTQTIGREEGNVYYV